MTKVNDLIGDINKDIAWLPERTIYLARHGSHCYGTSTPESDEDFRGVAIPPKEYFFGFIKHFHEFIRKQPDAVIFEIRKFFGLATDCNPNVIEILFVDSSDIIYMTKLGEKLLAHRDLFISRAAKERFLGYAKGQLHRIKNHRRWLFEPLKEHPKRSDFGLPEKLSIPNDQWLAVNSQLRKQLDTWRPDFEPFSEPQQIYLQTRVAETLAEMNITSTNEWMCAARKLGYSDNFILLLQKEKEYDARVSDWNNYQGWKQSRNPKRAALEAKYGYDCKHAMHLVRLCKMAKEILLEGKVIVKRPDAEELLAIRNGAWSYEQLIEYADKIQAEIKDAYFKSPLPTSPDRNKIDLLCQSIIEESL